MPRTARVVATGYAHHITQRGNRKLDIFLDDADREIYLAFLRQYCRKHGLDILAYCLMPNHVHIVGIPHEADSLARALAGAHMRYAQHFNWKYSQTGHLWQGRFFSCVLDDRHAVAAARYVERNPLRAGLVGRPWDYRWSSAPAHVGKRKDYVVSSRWPTKEDLEQWPELIVASEDTKKLDEIRFATRRGRPVGSLEFVEQLERLHGRTLTARRRGRPRKAD